MRKEGTHTRMAWKPAVIGPMIPSRLSAGRTACREESGWVAGGIGGSGRVLGLRLLAWQLERSLELRENEGLKSQLGNQWQKVSEVKILHRKGFREETKAQIRTSTNTRADGREAGMSQQNRRKKVTNPRGFANPRKRISSS